MESTRYPTREDIDKADDRPFVDMPTPELGEGVVVRVGTMCATDRDSFEQHVDEHGKANMTAALLVRCLVDPQTDARLYADDEVATLGKRGPWLSRAFIEAVRLNKIRRDSVETDAKN